MKNRTFSALFFLVKVAESIKFAAKNSTNQNEKLSHHIVRPY
jgi:hypothetical protein